MLWHSRRGWSYCCVIASSTPIHSHGEQAIKPYCHIAILPLHSRDRLFCVHSPARPGAWPDSYARGGSPGNHQSLFFQVELWPRLLWFGEIDGKCQQDEQRLSRCCQLGVSLSDSECHSGHFEVRGLAGKISFCQWVPGQPTAGEGEGERVRAGRHLQTGQVHIVPAPMQDDGEA